MNRKDMLSRLKAGYDTIDVSLEKWYGVRDGKGDDGDCALCHVHIGIDGFAVCVGGISKCEYAVGLDKLGHGKALTFIIMRRKVQ